MRCALAVEFAHQYLRTLVCNRPQTHRRSAYSRRENQVAERPQQVKVAIIAQLDPKLRKPLTAAFLSFVPRFSRGKGSPLSTGAASGGVFGLFRWRGRV